MADATNTPVAPAPTPGWKTTEFWLSFVAVLVSALMASDAIPSYTIGYKVLTIAATILTALGYTVSRTLLKSSHVSAASSALSAAPVAAPAPATLAAAKADAQVAGSNASATDLANQAAK